MQSSTGDTLDKAVIRYKDIIFWEFCVTILFRSLDENTETMLGWTVESQDHARIRYKVSVQPRTAVEGMPQLKKSQLRNRFKSNIWSCSCQDFKTNIVNAEHRCKHIGYIILTELQLWCVVLNKSVSIFCDVITEKYLLLCIMLTIFRDV